MQAAVSEKTATTATDPRLLLILHLPFSSSSLAFRFKRTTLVDNGARILMEDLGEVGFSVNQCNGLSRAQVTPLVEMAAAMHAAFWPGCEGAAVIPNNVVKGEDRRSFIRRWNDGFSRQSRYDEFVTSKGLKVYDIGVSEEVVLEIGAKIKANAAKILHHLTAVAPQTLIHADYRADNMILLHSGSCAVLDWQLHCTGPGAYDLTDIMVKSMKAADGVSCSEELLRHYHACLVAAGVKDYSWEQLNTDFRFSCLQVRHCVLLSLSISLSLSFTLHFLRETLLDQALLKRSPQMMEKDEHLR